MAENENVEVKGRTSDNATLLLAAAEELNLPAGVVETTGSGFRVPVEVAKKAGLDNNDDDKPRAAKKAAAKKAPAKDKE